MTDTKRTATTRNGEPIYLNESYEVDAGWESWVLHPDGYAVLVFVPAKEGGSS